MKLSEYCRQIIFSPHLSDKLFVPDAIEFDDFALDPLDVPILPARTTESSNSALNAKSITGFPNAKELQSPTGRAISFHFFANHELLALELMALTLIRFPGADVGFKRSIISALKDEQRHFGLYVQRMRDLGMDFGDIPSNFYFWNEMKNISSPMQYISGMSLTFEQANLDFAVHYQRLFSSIGDTESASILAKVHEDEIAHVTSGLNWLRNWKNPDLSDWQAYSENLPGHITATRARGLAFDEGSRLSCGFDREFIDEVMLARQSKGRRPALWVFNAGSGADATDVFDVQNLGRVGQLRKDLSPLMMFAAAPNDMILVPQKIELPLRKHWHNAGFPLSNFVTSEVLKNSRGEMRPDHIKYWEYNPETRLLCRDLDIPSFVSEQYLETYQNKSWIKKQILDGFESLPQSAVSSDEEVMAFVNQYQNHHSRFVMKRTTASSGQGHLLFSADQIPYTTIAKLRAEAATNLAEWIIEPWLDRRADFSTHGNVHAQTVEYVGATPFFATKRGQYFASLIGRANLGMFFHWLHSQLASEKISSIADEFKRVTLIVGQRLQKQGYTGPFSIDGMVYADNTGKICIRHTLEVNVRLTMGRIAFETSKHVDPSSTALFILPNRAMAKRMGHSSLNSFVQGMQTTHEIKSHRDRIQSGFACLSLCTEESHFSACLFVEKSIRDINQRLGYIAKLFPQWFLDQCGQSEEQV